jgi:hypothetical protein
MKMAQAMGINVPNRGGDPNAPPVAADPGTSSSLTDAVRSLGLKLESRKAPTEQLIVDHVEKLPQTVGSSFMLFQFFEHIQRHFELSRWWVLW